MQRRCACYLDGVCRRLKSLWQRCNTLELDTKDLNRAQYDALYEVLSAPDDSHAVVLPYGQTTLAFDAYVTSGEDTLVRMTDKGNYWKSLKVNLIAMAPQRT